MAEFVGVALLMVIVTIAFFVMAVLSQNTYTKIASGALCILMMLADIFVGRVIVTEIAPTASGFINIMDNFYLIGVRFFVFAMFFLFLWVLFRVLKYFKSIPERKRQDKQEEYLMGMKL